MKQILAILCIIAIILNVYVAVYQDDLGEEWTGGHGEDLENIDFSEFTVTVPEMMIGDVAQYDYSIFVEMFWENKTSGDWEKYTLTANGQLIDRLPPVTTIKDGFYMDHSTLYVREETEATFTIVIDGSDSEKITIHGSLNGYREEYTDLNEKNVIQVITDGHVEVDKIRQLPIPISYDGRMRSYPDPNAFVEESLDEKIYLGNKMRKVGDTGSILRNLEGGWTSEWLSQTYNWTIVGGETVAGYNSLIINISTGFFKDFMPFNKQIWIANEVSFPVKVFVRTNTSAEDEKGSFYTIIEHTRTLRKNGFTRGTKEIPWDACQAGSHFLNQNPRGEYQSWEYMPESGSSYDTSSFNFKSEDAVNYALENSIELKRFLNRYDDVVIAGAGYKVVKDAIAELDPAGKAGSYNWNLSFRYKPSYEEYVEAWENDEDPDWCYYVNLTRNLTKETGIDKYSEEIKIINEGSMGRTSPFSKSELASNTLTLAASETIFKLDDEIESEVYNTKGEIDFEDTEYYLWLNDPSSASSPGMSIIETITGISLPRTKYSWGVETGGLESGSSFSAAVDIETGQLQYILTLDGTALYGIFG
jgi:hypothetical protein